MTLAYLDAGSGSLIASALVGGAAAAGVVARQARAKLTGFGRKRNQEPDQTGQESETEPTDAEATDVAEAADAPDGTPAPVHSDS
jgi:hypothetical protein